MIDELAFFEWSPVVEVAVGVEFLQLPGLGAVRLVGLHDLWRSTFPKIQEQPALPPTAAVGMQGAFQFQFGPALSAPLRVWMLNDAEDELLQVQGDRLFLNWRKANGSERPYPRYDHLKEVYQAVFTDFRTYVERNELGTFLPHTAVVTYVNRFALRPGESLKDAFAPLNPEWSTLPSTGTTEVRQTFPLWFGDDPQAQNGVMNVVAGVNAVEDASHGYLEVVSRINVEHPGIDPFEALDVAHTVSVSSFVELTTPKMHQRWGKK